MRGWGAAGEACEEGSEYRGILKAESTGSADRLDMKRQRQEEEHPEGWCFQ